MRCTSHQTVTPTFARIHFSLSFLHNAPVTRVVYTSSFSRATTTPTPLSLVFTPFNVGTRDTPPLDTHTLTTKPPHKNSNKTCSHLSRTLKPLTQTLTCWSLVTFNTPFRTTLYTRWVSSNHLHRLTFLHRAYSLLSTWSRLFRLNIRLNHITRGPATQAAVRLASITSLLHRNIFTQYAPMA